MNEFKLYVWDECLYDYTSGMAVAVARSKEEALDTIKAWCLKNGNEYWWNDLAPREPKVYDLPAAAAVHGGG